MRPLDVPVPGMTSMTETPLLWCGEDEDNVELTLDDLEAGSGSDEIPPELRGIAREEWRKNHPDEQLSDDDTFDSYEMENTRIEVIGWNLCCQYIVFCLVSHVPMNKLTRTIAVPSVKPVMEH